MMVTGCSSGLGYESMRVLCLRGAKVLGLARSLVQASEACQSVAGDSIPIACDLTDLDSVRACRELIAEPIDGVIANAGVMALPELSLVRGIEEQMFVNHVGHAALIMQVLQQLTPEGRVVIVSSAAHSFARGKNVTFDSLEWRGPYKPWVAYGHSKLANILFARALSRRLPEGQTANSVHPGIVQTPLYRHLSAQDANRMTGNLKTISVEEGTATQVYVAAHPDAGRFTGRYVGNCEPRQPSVLARDDERGEQLWATTESCIASW